MSSKNWVFFEGLQITPFQKLISYDQQEWIDQNLSFPMIPNVCPYHQRQEKYSRNKTPCFKMPSKRLATDACLEFVLVQFALCGSTYLFAHLYYLRSDGFGLRLFPNSIGHEDFHQDSVASGTLISCSPWPQSAGPGGGMF